MNEGGGGGVDVAYLSLTLLLFVRYLWMLLRRLVGQLVVVRRRQRQ